MTYKLHMNGVITGSLNCFCLACDVFLKSPQDANGHVGTAAHQLKATAVQFSDKFKDEHIKKYKGGYYCEFCNVLMPTASKVNLHVTDDEHKHNKGLLLLKPMGLDVVAFNNVLIEERAWHGLIEGVCSLCNAEFEDENDHKTDAGHSLNLILKPIQFGADNAVFRALDDTAVQCLTCNKLLAPGRMSKHLDDTEHHEIYAKRRIETNRVCQGSDAQENYQKKASNMTSVIENYDDLKKPKVENDAIEKNNEKSPTKEKSKILESIAKYQTKGININLETETAFCKKCSKVVTFDFMEIENHIENHSSATAAAVDFDLLYPSKVDPNLNRVDINDKTTQSSVDKNNDEVSNGTLKALPESIQIDSSSEEDDDTDSSSSNDDGSYSQEEEARDFAKANKLTYNENNNQSFCRICKVHVPKTFRSMKEHVEGANHKRRVPCSMVRTKTPGLLVKQSTKEFVDTAYAVRGPFYNASVINEKYCMFRKSFYLLTENSSRVRCILCEVNVPPNMDTAHHAKSKQHLMKWFGAPVIISEENEFIREVRPGLFHCGFCNLVVSGWPDMKLHLESINHRQGRTVWQIRLRNHLPNVQRHKMQEQLDAMSTIRFFNMFN